MAVGGAGCHHDGRLCADHVEIIIILAPIELVLLDAGHLGQTFVTQPGWVLRLSVTGFEGFLIEEDLGIDGISESVLYVTGVRRTARSTNFVITSHAQRVAAPGAHG